MHACVVRRSQIRMEPTTSVVWYARSHTAPARTAAVLRDWDLVDVTVEVITLSEIYRLYVSCIYVLYPWLSIDQLEGAYLT